MHRELAMNVDQRIIWLGTVLSDFLDLGRFVGVVTDMLTIPQPSTGTVGEDSNLLRLDFTRFLMVGELFSISIRISQIPLLMTLYQRV